MHHRVPHEPYLCTRGQRWPYGEPVVAECRPHGTRRADHLNMQVHGAAPARKCKCGLYAAATPEDLALYFRRNTQFFAGKSPEEVLGHILWGAVAMPGSARYFSGLSPEGYYYWRSERVELLALVRYPKRSYPTGAISERWELLARLYGVPLLAAEDIQPYAEEHGEYLEEVSLEASRKRA